MMTKYIAEIMPIDRLLLLRGRGPLVWEVPLEFDLAIKSDQNQLKDTLNSQTSINVIDPVLQIADDLFEMENPDKKHDDQARSKFVEGIVDQGAGFGKWFLFPWSNELVRYPRKSDHRALRTSRNRNLITDEEQAKLYDSTIAVFGLSVGSKVVSSMVESGIGGKIMIGDPDYITPSNLNRVKGKYSDVGVRKVDLAAMQISETDPYLEQVHFKDGVTVNNIIEVASHEPDVICDEVDNLAIKASLRLFAKEHRTPLLMATDLGDRSMLDVERHDQGAKPFNGRVKALEVEKLSLGTTTAEEQKKLMLKIVGLRHVTTRMLTSVMEQDKSLSGLPQLGITATVGGALAATAAREIILERNLPSGRYVYSPKELLNLDPQTNIVNGFSVVKKFLKSK